MRGVELSVFVVFFFKWKICLILRSFFAVFLWWQVVLLWLGTADGLGIAVVPCVRGLLLINLV